MPIPCVDCGQVMDPGAGCTVEKLVLQTIYDRIKFGSEDPVWVSDDPDETCHDCNVRVGQYHHFGCDVERCPVCKGQIISCEHRFLPEREDEEE